MSKSDAHRTEFTVRCACGIEYHTSDAHIGHALPCKCGRMVVIARPMENREVPKIKTRRKKRRFEASDSETRRAINLNAGFRDRVSLWSWFIEPLRFGNRLERTVFITAWAYLASMIGAWMLLWFGSEHTIPGTIIAYGPRWLSLWPLAVLVPATLVFARSALLALVVATWVGVVPIMGARVSFATMSDVMPPKPIDGTFRVMTFNAQGGRGLVFDIRAMLEEVSPDIVMLQECNERLWNNIRQLTGWYVANYSTLCMISRWPMNHFEQMPRDEILRVANGQGAGLVMRAFIDSPKGPLIAVNLHLETARRGLEGMLRPGGFIPDADTLKAPGPQSEERQTSPTENASRFTANVAVRDKESALASHWARESIRQTTTIVGGDFNLPVESTIFQRHWNDFVDAFEETGNGLGWTKIEGRWLRIRIDHLLTAKDGPKPLRVSIGPDFQSDHLPVVADYAWSTTQPHASSK